MVLGISMKVEAIAYPIPTPEYRIVFRAAEKELKIENSNKMQMILHRSLRKNLKFLALLIAWKIFA